MQLSRFVAPLLSAASLAALSFALTSCREQAPPVAQTGAARSTSAIQAASRGCGGATYGRPRELARVQDKRITESSGIARSLVRDDCFWTHNDGKTPRLYCIDKQGETVGIVKLEGADFVDCEDIASFTRDGKNYLLYADIGDNELDRREYRLHLIEEPRLKGKAKKPQDAPIAMTIRFHYPDGPQNCEAAAVDRATGKVYLATKERSRGSRVYELALPAAPPPRPLEARLVARLEMRSVAAMDISPDSRRAVVLTDTAAFEFSRAAEEDWLTAFRGERCLLPMPPRKNGESICYGADGKTLYLTSEGRGEPLWQIPAVE